MCYSYILLWHFYLAKLTSVRKVVSSSCVMIRGPSTLIKGILKEKYNIFIDNITITN